MGISQVPDTLQGLFYALSQNIPLITLQRKLPIFSLEETDKKELVQDRTGDESTSLK